MLFTKREGGSSGDRVSWMVSVSCWRCSCSASCASGKKIQLWMQSSTHARHTAVALLAQKQILQLCWFYSTTVPSCSPDSYRPLPLYLLLLAVIQLHWCYHPFCHLPFMQRWSERDFNSWPWVLATLTSGQGVGLHTLAVDQTHRWKKKYLPAHCIGLPNGDTLC